MTGIIRAILFILSLWSISGEPFRFIGASADFDIPIYVENSLDNTDAGEFWQGSYVAPYAKRFWPNHPSDYNPMRRPNKVVKQSSKRDYDDLPYHPLAKGVSLIQRLGNGADDYEDALVDAAEVRMKKNIWPANLVYRLGRNVVQSGPSRGKNRQQKYVPSEPPTN